MTNPWPFASENEKRRSRLNWLEPLCTAMESWRRRADSNRRIGVLQTPALDRLATSPDIRMRGAEEETRTPTAV